MITCTSSSGRRPSTFALRCNALLPCSLRNIRRFGVVLSPVHYRRRTPRPVSYYALFKWWLLLSQHPGCPGDPTSFRTEHSLGTLAGGLGCSPLDDEAYPSPSSCPGLVQRYSEFGFEGEPGGPPIEFSRSTPAANYRDVNPKVISERTSYLHV